MGLGPNIYTTPLWQWGFRQCLPFSWTTLRGKNYRQPIAVMGVVDTFRPEESHLPSGRLTETNQEPANV